MPITFTLAHLFRTQRGTLYSRSICRPSPLPPNPPPFSIPKQIIKIRRQLLNALDSIKKGQEILDRNDVTQKFHTPPYAKRHLDLFGGSIPESKSSVQKRLSRMENDLEQHQNPKGSCCSKPDSTLTAEDRQGTIQSLGAKITKLSNTLKGIERMELELEKLKGMPTPSGAAEKEKHHQKIRELKERLGIGGHQEACCGLSATASVETCICLQFRPTVIGSKEFWEDGQGCAWAYHGDSKCDAVHNFCCACRVKHKRYDFTRTGMQITDVPSLCDEIWLKYFCCLCWDWYAVWGQNEDFDFRFLKEMDRTDEPTCWHWCHLRTLRLGFQNETHDKIKLEKERIAREEATICCGACLRSSLPCKRDYTPNILDNDGDDRQWVIIRHPALTKQWEGHFRYIWDNVRLVASSHA